MPPAFTLRVLTYNVHRCIGWDGQLAPARVARVIAGARADLVALQELDAGHARTGYHDQARLLADLLHMHHVFHPAVSGPAEHYGDAILSRYPLTVVRRDALPTVIRPVLPERRGALWVTVTCAGQPVQLLNTHLGLGRRERLVQVEALLGADWLGNPACAAPRLLCGDFNAWPGSAPYQSLRRTLRDAQVGPGSRRPRSTFPSSLPVLRIDHIFHSPDLQVRDVRVPRTRLARVASDHLPLLVEVSWP